jgi:hypothetical protein
MAEQRISKTHTGKTPPKYLETRKKKAEWNSCDLKTTQPVNLSSLKTHLSSFIFAY